MARGDIVLCKYVGWDCTIIEWATHGPFCHVEIDLGDGTFIGAHGNGISKVPSAVGSQYVYVTPKATDADINAAIVWAEKQLGQAYGWTDIFNDGLKLFGIPLTISLDKMMDCSDFVTRYLLVARAAGPLGELALNPSKVSPNDIGRAFGVL